MNPRKVSSTVLKRSVFKNIKKNTDERVCGPLIGLDACSFRESDNTTILSCIVPAILGMDYTKEAVIKAAGNIACVGGDIRYVMADLIFGSGYDEKHIKYITKQICVACEQLGIRLQGGSTRLAPNVSDALISITGVGAVSDDKLLSIKNITPGMDIVAVGCICKEAMNYIANVRKDEIRTRFGEVFLNKLIENNKDISILDMAYIGRGYGAYAMHDTSEGGILASLYELSEGANVGVSVELKKIPISQSTVEVCEFYDINPYRLLSGGALLVVCRDGENLVDIYKEKGYASAVIGHTLDNNDKMIIGDDEIGYIDTPSRDEIYNFISVGEDPFLLTKCR